MAAAEVSVTGQDDQNEGADREAAVLGAVAAPTAGQ